MRKNYFLLVILLSSLVTACAGTKRAPSSAEAMPPVIRIATSADTHPYNFGPADGCRSPDGVCGFEIDLFNAICAEMKVSCSWSTVAWADIFTNLNQASGEGNFSYDAIVASAEASAERRADMLFSARYYTAWHLFLGRRSLAVKFDEKGFPLPGSRPLRLGTWDGFLMDELRQAYPSLPAGIELKAVDSPLESLKKGEIDLAFVFTGTEVAFLKDRDYAMKGRLIEVLNTDPEAGIGAASRKSPAGEEIQRIFSEGLVRVRRKGIYQKISQKWLGRDIWDRQLGPKVE